MSTSAEEVRVVLSVVDIFRSSVLLLDEVDLILHPLKSELNWPLGQKLPLDFTQSQVGFGLRWQIPFHIIDALFVGAESSIPIMKRESREAIKILDDIKIVIRAGLKRKEMQAIPHLVLLSRQFYKQKLKPLLARWLLLWLATKKLSGAPDEDLMSYLMSGTTTDNRARMLKLSRVLHDDHIKMLNLGRDWLTSLLPFVLSKINRVNFGLLNPEDLDRALAMIGVKNRRFLAVPFVGKDVPSRSSNSLIQMFSSA